MSKNLRNIFLTNHSNKNILFVETKKYLLMEEPKDKIDNFILRTQYNPNKIYNIVKKNNKYKNVFKSNKSIFNRNDKLKMRNNTFNAETNKLKEKKLFGISKNHSTSLKTQKIKNCYLNIANFANIPKMRISKNVILNMHPINLRIFLK